MEEPPFDFFPPFVDPSSPGNAPTPSTADPAVPAAPAPAAPEAPHPGASGALKHGFYSRSFNPGDQQLLAGIHFGSLKDEITMLRVFIRRVTDLAAGVASLPEAFSLLRFPNCPIPNPLLFELFPICFIPPKMRPPFCLKWVSPIYPPNCSIPSLSKGKISDHSYKFVQLVVSLKRRG